MNANTWTRNLNKATDFANPFRYNDFGFAIGGPVAIPIGFVRADVRERAWLAHEAEGKAWVEWCDLLPPGLHPRPHALPRGHWRLRDRPAELVRHQRISRRKDIRQVHSSTADHLRTTEIGRWNFGRDRCVRQAIQH